MSRNRKRIGIRWISAFILLYIIFVIFYFSYVRSWIDFLYHDPNQAPTFFKNLVNGLYPRFEVEKQRFSLSFFKAKADQLVLRAFLVILFFGGILMCLSYNRQSARRFYRRFFAPLTDRRWLHGVGVTFTICCLLFFADWLPHLLTGHRLAFLYEPVFLLKVLGVPFPSRPFLIFLFFSGLVALVLTFSPVTRIYASIYFALVFIYLQGFLYSFQKLDHTYATFNYAVLGMPLIWLSYEKALKKQQRKAEAWPLLLIRLAIALAYSLAGLEKVFTAGAAWVAPNTLATYLTLHGQALGLWVAELPWLCSLLSMATLVFELGFPLILFFPSLRYGILAGGILFHWSIYWLMGVGGIFNPWIVVYIFYVDWPKKKRIRR